LRSFWIHVGWPKTGTTSIQSFMATRQAWLNAHGAFFPETGCINGVHYRLSRDLAQLRFGPARYALKDELAGRIGTGIVSCEVFQPPVASTIATIARRADFEPLLLLYVRAIAPALNATYAQNIKALHPFETFEEWLPRRLGERVNSLRHWPALSNRIDVPLLVRPFNRDTKIFGVVRDFLHSIGLEPPAEEPPRHNESVGPVYIEASRLLITEHFPPPKRTKDALPMRRALEKVYSAAGLDEPNYSVLSPQVVSAIDERARDTTSKFAMKYMGADWPEVFSEEATQQYAPNDLRIIDDRDGLKLAQDIAREAAARIRERRARIDGRSQTEPSRADLRTA